MYISIKLNFNGITIIVKINNKTYNKSKTKIEEEEEVFCKREYIKKMRKVMIANKILTFHQMIINQMQMRMKMNQMKTMKNLPKKDRISNKENPRMMMIKILQIVL